MLRHHVRTMNVDINALMHRAFEDPFFNYVHWNWQGWCIQSWGARCTVPYTAFDLQLMSVFLWGDLRYGICRNWNLLLYCEVKKIIYCMVLVRGVVPPETGQYAARYCIVYDHARPLSPSRRSDAQIEFRQITVLHRATGMVIAASLAASLNCSHPNQAISRHVSYYCHSWSELKKWGSTCCTLGGNQLYQYHRGCRSQPVRYLAGKPRYCIEHAASRVYANDEIQRKEDHPYTR